MIKALQILIINIRVFRMTIDFVEFSIQRNVAFCEFNGHLKCDLNPHFCANGVIDPVKKSHFGTLQLFFVISGDLEVRSQITYTW